MRLEIVPCSPFALRFNLYYTRVIEKHIALQNKSYIDFLQFANILSCFNRKTFCITNWQYWIYQQVHEWIRTRLSVFMSTLYIDPYLDYGVQRYLSATFVTNFWKCCIILGDIPVNVTICWNFLSITVSELFHFKVRDSFGKHSVET